MILNWLIQFIQYDSFIMLIVMCIFFGGIEFFIPAKKMPTSHMKFNFLYGLTSTIIGFILTPFISGYMAFALQKWVSPVFDLQAISREGIVGDLLAVFIATALFDFFFYWYHRLQHKNRILWKVHLLHHSDEFMNVTTGARGHIFELFLVPIFTTIPMALLFQLPPAKIAVLNLIPITWIYIQHANLNISLGPFWWLLTTPNYHRIHHSIEAKHRDKNLAEFFPIFDIIFGTCWRPKKGEIPATGVKGVKLSSLKEAYLLPFKK